MVTLYFAMHEDEKNGTEKEIMVKDLYPGLSPLEIAEAEYHLMRYLALVKKIYERLERENPEFLTELESLAMLRTENTDYSET